MSENIPPNVVICELLMSPRVNSAVNLVLSDYEQELLGDALQSIKNIHRSAPPPVVIVGTRPEGISDDGWYQSIASRMSEEEYEFFSTRDYGAGSKVGFSLAIGRVSAWLMDKAFVQFSNGKDADAKFLRLLAEDVKSLKYDD